MSQVELARIFLSKRAYKASGNIIDDGEQLQCLDEVVPLYFVMEVFNMLEEGSFGKFMQDLSQSVPEFIQAHPDLMEVMNKLEVEKRSA